MVFLEQQRHGRILLYLADGIGHQLEDILSLSFLQFDVVFSSEKKTKIATVACFLKFQIISQSIDYIVVLIL
jgi:hypothetical protein